MDTLARLHAGIAGITTSNLISSHGPLIGRPDAHLHLSHVDHLWLVMTWRPMSPQLRRRRLQRPDHLWLRPHQLFTNWPNSHRSHNPISIGALGCGSSPHFGWMTAFDGFLQEKMHSLCKPFPAEVNHLSRPKAGRRGCLYCLSLLHSERCPFHLLYICSLETQHPLTSTLLDVIRSASCSTLMPSPKSRSGRIQMQAWHYP